MSKKASRGPATNFVSEWFGHIVWPPAEVDDSPAALKNQREELCPFLSDATRAPVHCTKSVPDPGGAYRTGFCTQSSSSNGPRQDWLACPNRVFDAEHTLIEAAIRRLYSVPESFRVTVDPITRFSTVEFRTQRLSDLASPTTRVFAFAANPPALGGEIDIPESRVASGSKVDVTIVELVKQGYDFEIARSVIFEIQTADFHGSPKHAIGELRRLGPPGARNDQYHALIRQNPNAMGAKLEGPNKANIFKRMIYQMLVKMEMAAAASSTCAGFCVVLPEPVWDSWARHLGAPTFVPHPTDPNAVTLGDLPKDQPISAWVLIFEVDRSSKASPKPLRITKQIATNAATLSELAFKVAPERGVAEGAMNEFRANFQRRFEQAMRVLPVQNKLPPEMTADPRSARIEGEDES